MALIIDEDDESGRLGFPSQGTGIHAKVQGHGFERVHVMLVLSGLLGQDGQKDGHPASGFGRFDLLGLLAEVQQFRCFPSQGKYFFRQSWAGSSLEAWW